MSFLSSSGKRIHNIDTMRKLSHNWDMTKKIRITFLLQLEEYNCCYWTSAKTFWWISYFPFSYMCWGCHRRRRCCCCCQCPCPQQQHHHHCHCHYPTYLYVTQVSYFLPCSRRTNKIPKIHTVLYNTRQKKCISKTLESRVTETIIYERSH